MAAPATSAPWGCYTPRALQPLKALQKAWFAHSGEDASPSSWAKCSCSHASFTTSSETSLAPPVTSSSFCQAPPRHRSLLGTGSPSSALQDLGFIEYGLRAVPCCPNNIMDTVRNRILEEIHCGWQLWFIVADLLILPVPRDGPEHTMWCLNLSSVDGAV